jgi:enoyl-CoA hydratase
MKYDNIIVEKKDHVGLIKINRPESLNALNQKTICELINAVNDFDIDTEIKVAVITGEGKAFIAGADIKEMKDMTPLQAKEFGSLGHDLMHMLERSQVIYIAAVNGFALGGGCELMMACDLMIASKNAVMGQPEINLGVHPGFGGTQRLPRLIGSPKAKELMLTGRNIKADEAFAIGLINKVVEPESLMDEAEKLAMVIASKSMVQIGFIKELVNKGINVDLQTACNLEISYFSASFATHDQKEGMTAFIEKRKADFINE